MQICPECDATIAASLDSGDAVTSTIESIDKSPASGSCFFLPNVSGEAAVFRRLHRLVLPIICYASSQDDDASLKRL